MSRMKYVARQRRVSRGTMDKDAECELLSVVGDTLLLFMECMTGRDGKRPEHISAIYDEVIRVVRELRDQS